MTVRKINFTLIAKLALITVLLALIGWLALVAGGSWGKPSAEAADVTGLFDAKDASPYKAGLPAEGSFEQIAESDTLKLLADKTTAHFQVINKSTGKVWRSYPDPQYWKDETVPNTWKNNLSSPIMVEYVNAKNYKSSSVTAGLIENQGYLENFQATETGFTVTFTLPKAEFKIPVEVSLHKDYVETRIVDSGIVEGALSLLNVKLYPLFGAQPSVGQEGYIVLPDGSGSLINFAQDRIMPQLTYNESVYGQDLSYYNENTGRQRIAMPVYGIKSGDQAFVAIISQGEAFANVYAAPSGAVGRSNWATTEWQYRKRFFQSVSKSTGEGFYTYSGDKFIADARATRYYPLPPEKSDYAGMAEVYRNYLIDEQGVKPLEAPKKDIPLFVDIVGADIEKGLFADSYLKATTTAEAEELVRHIYDLGIRHLQVNFSGWQQDGYSTHGGYFPVDKRLGGNSGMKSFISFAHSLDIPVYLTANYTLNTNGDDRFWWRRDGLRNLAGTVLEEQRNSDQDAGTFVSPRFYEKVVAADLNDYKSLGADGIYYEDGIGQQVNTDFNSRYQASREDVALVQRTILKKTKETLGSLAANNVNFYALDQIDHVHRLTDDYSYDVFISEQIPFAQMVLHGLRTYTLEWSNLRNEFGDGFLRSIEYGAYPAYVLSGDKAADLKKSYSLWYYSLNYKDWIDDLKDEYERTNEALAAVQDQYITAHRTLAAGVKETVYGSDYLIIVNYNQTDYSKDGVFVPAKDFVVIKGGTKL
ncbi:DUF5696 domain-containing protein [Paenibacillus sp. Soil522]|uniref:DUF5696 domain-containing protein n=1 Tax=Paenibacillus sp. Soil522 TaxID=1736388 RepID=UPI0006F68074|nr:DUF5696 domain-containing protein [Paenibacillus sp. Soil522]KRE44955.1 hypothetical protein ASG81_14835 [Paenibacillus sp. Soil522]